MPRIQSAMAETATAKAETANLLVQLNEARAETANLLVQLNEARAETVAARAESTTAKAESTTAKAETATAKAETATAKAETANVIVQLDAASALVRKAEDTAETASAEATALRAKVRRAEDTATAARARAAAVSLPAFINMRRLELDSIERDINGVQVIRDLFDMNTLRGGVGAVRFGLLDKTLRVAVKIFVDGYIGDSRSASSYLTNELQVLSGLLDMYGFDGLRNHCIVRPLGMASIPIMPKGVNDKKQYISAPALLLEEWHSPPPPRMSRTPNVVKPPSVRTLEQLLEWEAEGWTQTVRIIRDIAVGLAAMHEAGFAHNDIKDDNVLVRLTAGGTFRTACVTDMSHASSADGNGQRTGNGDKCGAPSDVGSVGRMIRKLLLGTAAWDTSFKETKHYTQMQDLSNACLQSNAQGQRPPMASVVNSLNTMKD